VTTLFDRAGFCQIGDRRFLNLHFRFKVTKSLSGEPNTAEVQVWGLSESSRAAIPDATVPVLLVAGYKDATEVVFFGDARTVDHEKQGPDWVTHIRCGDGERRYEDAYSAMSFGPGTEVKKVIEQLATDLGVSSRDALQALRSGDVKTAFSKFLQGYAAQGRTVRELDRVTKAAQVDWSTQDGSLQLLEPGKATKDEAVLLSPATGMILSPTHGKPQKPGEPSYLKVRSLLMPRIRPGRSVQVDSAQYKGVYRCERVVHAGDIYGQEWQTETDLLMPGPAPAAAESPSDEGGE